MEDSEIDESSNDSGHLQNDNILNAGCCSSMSHRVPSKLSTRYKYNKRRQSRRPLSDLPVSNNNNNSNNDIDRSSTTTQKSQTKHSSTSTNTKNERSSSSSSSSPSQLGKKVDALFSDVQQDNVQQLLDEIAEDKKRKQEQDKKKRDDDDNTSTTLTTSLSTAISKSLSIAPSSDTSSSSETTIDVTSCVGSSDSNGTSAAVPSSTDDYLQSLLTNGNDYQRKKQYDDAYWKYVEGYQEAYKLPGTGTKAATFAVSACAVLSHHARSRGVKLTQNQVETCRSLLDSVVPESPESPVECAAALSLIRCYIRQMKSSNSIEEIVELNSQLESLANKIKGKNGCVNDDKIQNCLDTATKIAKKAFAAHDNATSVPQQPSTSSKPPPQQRSEGAGALTTFDVGAGALNNGFTERDDLSCLRVVADFIVNKMCLPLYIENRFTGETCSATTGQCFLTGDGCLHFLQMFHDQVMVTYGRLVRSGQITDENFDEYVNSDDFCHERFLSGLGNSYSMNVELYNTRSFRVKSICAPENAQFTLTLYWDGKCFSMQYHPLYIDLQLFLWKDITNPFKTDDKVVTRVMELLSAIDPNGITTKHHLWGLLPITPSTTLKDESVVKQLTGRFASPYIEFTTQVGFHANNTPTPDSLEALRNECHILFEGTLQFAASIYAKALCMKVEDWLAKAHHVINNPDSYTAAAVRRAKRLVKKLDGKAGDAYHTEWYIGMTYEQSPLERWSQDYPPDMYIYGKPINIKIGHVDRAGGKREAEILEAFGAALPQIATQMTLGNDVVYELHDMGFNEICCGVAPWESYGGSKGLHQLFYEITRDHGEEYVNTSSFSTAELICFTERERDIIVEHNRERHNDIIGPNDQITIRQANRGYGKIIATKIQDAWKLKRMGREGDMTEWQSNTVQAQQEAGDNVSDAWKLKRMGREGDMTKWQLKTVKAQQEGAEKGAADVKTAWDTAVDARDDKQKGIVKACLEGGEKGGATNKAAWDTAADARDDKQKGIVAARDTAAETHKLSTQVDKLENIVAARKRADKVVCNRMKNLTPAEARRISMQSNLLLAGGEGTKLVYEASCDKCTKTKFTASIITGPSCCPGVNCGNHRGWTMVSDQPLSQELCKTKHRELQQSNTAGCGVHYFVEENSCDQNYSSTPAKGSTYRINLTCDCGLQHKAYIFEERLSKAETVNVYNELNEQLEERTSNQKKRTLTLQQGYRIKKKQRKDI